MTLFLIAFVVVAVIFAFKRGRSSQFNDPHSPPTPANDGGVLGLIHQQKLIEAIKLYMEIHHVGLKEAKDAVEALAAGKPVAAPPASTANPASDADVLTVIRGGNLIDAIRMYRELHGTDLATAVKAVKALAETLPKP